MNEIASAINWPGDQPEDQSGSSRVHFRNADHGIGSEGMSEKMSMNRRSIDDDSEPRRTELRISSYFFFFFSSFLFNYQSMDKS